ncbi:hypothetical protein NEF87_001409 [Candidatus Lokiarchaeum ossiferum]|uniref:Uncharacterized protein n=1 Tax=Candidatus Lokiarchaeum ossiferum TaxID=2951803 RepID=A0ABY6HRC1_9ARCH|nr:hypothetical protein NEF87_001409 [Candidatus Lokiarchaeum sp. B-35]
MTSNVFSKKNEIEDLLDNLILQRNIFVSEVDLDMWKSAYVSIFGISNVLDNQLKHGVWKHSQFEKPLKELKRKTNKFVKLIRRKGINHGKWEGACAECTDILREYQDLCLPQIEIITQELDESNPIRIEIENQLGLNIKETHH